MGTNRIALASGLCFSAAQIVAGRKVAIHTAASESAEVVKIEVARLLGRKIIFI